MKPLAKLVMDSVAAIQKSGWTQAELDGKVLSLVRVIGREHLDEQGAEACHNRLVECASGHRKMYRDGLAFLAMNRWANQ